jgi:hypothetical protein
MMASNSAISAPVMETPVFITRLNTILRTLNGFAQQGCGECTCG